MPHASGGSSPVSFASADGSLSAARSKVSSLKPPCTGEVSSQDDEGVKQQGKDNRVQATEILKGESSTG